MISAQESENIFEFGEGVRRKSIGLFSIPCSVAGHDIILHTDVVEQDNLPCLLSNESMKRAGVKIDVGSEKIMIFGHETKLKINATGYYTLQLKDLVGEQNSLQEFQVSS